MRSYANNNNTACHRLCLIGSLHAALHASGLSALQSIVGPLVSQWRCRSVLIGVVAGRIGLLGLGVASVERSSKLSEMSASLC